MPLENENKVVNDIRDEPVNEIVAEPIEEIAAQKSIDQDCFEKRTKRWGGQGGYFLAVILIVVAILVLICLGIGIFIYRRHSNKGSQNSADSERFATSTYPDKSGYQAIPDSTTNAVMHVNPQFCRLHHP